MSLNRKAYSLAGATHAWKSHNHSRAKGLGQFLFPFQSLADRSNYSALVTACEESTSGFKAHLFPIEVGCLRYSPNSLLHCLEAFGLPKSTARQLRTQCSRVARRCSCIIFLRRGIKPSQEMSRLYSATATKSKMDILMFQKKVIQANLVQMRKRADHCELQLSNDHVCNFPFKTYFRSSFWVFLSEYQTTRFLQRIFLFFCVFTSGVFQMLLYQVETNVWHQSNWPERDERL